MFVKTGKLVTGQQEDIRILGSNPGGVLPGYTGNSLYIIRHDYGRLSDIFVINGDTMTVDQLHVNPFNKTEDEYVKSVRIGKLSLSKSGKSYNIFTRHINAWAPELSHKIRAKYWISIPVKMFEQVREGKIASCDVFTF